MQYYTLFYKSNFIRTKALILGRKKKKKKEQVKDKAKLAVPQKIRKKEPRLAILKIIRTKHQNKA